MKKTKLEKGITLIALIITIVVLLILAVVTIGSIRESSIITHSQNAKDSWSKSQTQEELELKVAQLQIDMVQNSSKYEFKLLPTEEYEENGTIFILDDGSLKNIFDSVDITIASSELTSEGKYKFNPEKFERSASSVVGEGEEEYYICSYNIPCINKKNEEIMVNMKYTLCYYETDEEEYYSCQITQVRALGELGKAINALNEKIINNQNNYKVPGTDDEALISLMQLIYDSIINEGIKIESTELLNSEKNGFDFAILWDEENPKVELISGGSTSVVGAFDCNCSKEGETLTIRPIFVSEYDSDTKERYSYINAFIIK